MTYPASTPADHPDEQPASGASLLARFGPATTPAAATPAPSVAATTQAVMAPDVAVAEPAPTAWAGAVAVRAPRAASEAASAAAAQAQALAAAAAALPRSATDPGPPRGPDPDGGRGGDEGTTWLRSRLRRLRIGSHLASRPALAYLSPAGRGPGLIAGIDYYRRPIAVRLFRPEPTRVALVGGVWAAQLLAFRAFALGAQVVVISEHAQQWLSFAQHATGRTDRLYAVAPESVIGTSTPRAPVLVIDDRGVASPAGVALGPWQTQLTVIHHLDQSGVPLVSGCDLAVLQRLSAVEASIATHTLRLPGHSAQSLQAIPDDALALVAGGTDCYVHVAQTDLERSYVGTPSPRTQAPLPASAAATLPAPPAPAVVAPPPAPAAVPAPPTAEPVRPAPASPATPPSPPAPAAPEPVAPPPVPAPAVADSPAPPPPPRVTPAVPPATDPQWTVPAVSSTPPTPPQVPTAPPAPLASPAPQPAVIPTAPPVPPQPPVPAYPAPPGHVPPSGPIPGIHIGRLPVTRDGVLVPGQRIDDEFDIDDEPHSARQRRGMTAGVGAIVLLALVGWAAGFLLSGKAPTAGPSPQASVRPSPQIVAPPPLPVPEITVVVEADGIRFTWTYENPLPGDWFRVTRLNVSDPVPEDLFEPTYLVQDDDDPCIEVRVIRGNGQGGQPERACYPQ